MKMGYDNAFDVLVDAQADQERDAVRESADAFRRTPAFLPIANDDAESNHWASIGRAAFERDHWMRKAVERHAHLVEAVAKRRLEEDKARAERYQREIASIHEKFECIQDARCSFLAWRHVSRLD